MGIGNHLDYLNYFSIIWIPGLSKGTGLSVIVWFIQVKLRYFGMFFFNLLDLLGKGSKSCCLYCLHFSQICLSYGDNCRLWAGSFETDMFCFTR